MFSAKFCTSTFLSGEFRRLCTLGIWSGYCRAYSGSRVADHPVGVYYRISITTVVKFDLNELCYLLELRAL